MVRNEHTRRLPVPPEEVGALIDTLAGQHDRLWAWEHWPAMRFDRPLSVGARGGHGPVRYVVEEYRPGARIRFRFRKPAGFDGHHEYAVEPGPGGGSLLRHTIAMRTIGLARLSWPLFFLPLHDACLEDGLDKAARVLGAAPSAAPSWSPRVRLLRALALRAGSVGARA